MTEGTDIFSSKINQSHFWKFYEIKACLFRRNIDADWQAIFFYVRLLTDKVNTTMNLPETAHFRLLHEVDEISKLGNLLNQIRHKEVKIRSVAVSLQLMIKQPNYEFYPKSYGLFGINEPSYGLSLVGKSSQEFDETRRNIELELQKLSLPFESIMDAVGALLGLHFWNFSYSPFVVVFAPIPIKIASVEFTQKKIAIALSCSNDVELEHLRLNLYSKDLGGIPNPQKPITVFSRYKNTDRVTHPHIKSAETSVYLKIVLLYKNEPIEERSVQKTLPLPAQPELRTSRKIKKFDAFVSYHELTGKDYAETTKKCLEPGIRTFVAHVERPTFSGDFEQKINAVILQCKYFILLINVGTLEREQVIRETRTAYPRGLGNRPKLFVFCQKQYNVRRRLDYFVEQTGMDIRRENQHDFRNDSELASRVITLVEEGEFSLPSDTRRRS
jgi:hypothetical protein